MIVFYTIIHKRCACTEWIVKQIESSYIHYWIFITSYFYSYRFFIIALGINNKGRILDQRHDANLWSQFEYVSERSSGGEELDFSVREWSMLDPFPVSFGPWSPGPPFHWHSVHIFTWCFLTVNKRTVFFHKEFLVCAWVRLKNVSESVTD